MSHVLPPRSECLCPKAGLVTCIHPHWSLCLRNLASWPSALTELVSATVRPVPQEILSSSCGHSDFHKILTIYVYIDVYLPLSTKDLNKLVKICAISSDNVVLEINYGYVRYGYIQL